MRPYDERLDHFLSRAAKVFADQGYHSTTMRDLARSRSWAAVTPTRSSGCMLSSGTTWRFSRRIWLK